MREVILRQGRVMAGFDGFGLGAQNLALPGAFQGTSAQDKWDQIATQITAEGDTPQGKVADRLATAQGQYLGKLQSFITSGITQQEPDLAKLAGAAQSATLVTNSVLGAVNAVQGIAAGIRSGNAQEVESGVQALVGIIASIAVLTGTFSAGVGAAIGAAIELTFEVLSAAGILPGVQAGTDVGDGHCSNMGFTSQGQAATGGIIPADLKSDLASPGANGEGVCVWGALVSPGSPNWRAFPDPNNQYDAIWYNVVTEATWFWPPGFGQAKWYTKNVGNWRPIDNAFHVYRTLECEIDQNYALANGAGPGRSTSLAALGFLRAPAAVAFLQAYFHMWKKNKEFELNGLKSAPDTAVLEQLVAIWNTAHEPGDGLDFFPSPHQYDASVCTNLTTTYVSMLVSDLVNANSTALSLAMDGSGATVLHINTGNQKNPPNTGISSLCPQGTIFVPGFGGGSQCVPLGGQTNATSTARKVAVGAAAVAAVGAGSLYAYASLEGLTLMQALRSVKKRIIP